MSAFCQMLARASVWAALSALLGGVLMAQENRSASTLTGLLDSSSEYLIERWQTDDGLPQNSITAIAQTPDGYLWVATFRGLARFDGARFVVFDASNTPQLPSSRLIRLFVDCRGWLWIGSEYGDVTLLKDGEFIAFSRKKNDADSGDIPIQGVDVLGEDESGNIWAFARSGGGCYRYDNGALALQQGVNRINPAGLMFLTTRFEGSFWDGRGNRAHWLVRAEPASSGESSGDCWRVGSANLKDLWVHTTRGTAKLRDDRWDWSAAPPSEPSQISETSALWEAKDGRLWLAFNRGRIACAGPDGDFRQFVLGDSSEPEGVRCFLEDQEGNIWAGTEANGLFRLKRRTFFGYSMEHGLSSKLAKSVTEDTAGRIWVASGTEARCFIDGKPPAVSLLPPLGEPWCVFGDRSGALWTGTYGGAVSTFREGKRSIVIMDQGEPMSLLTKCFFEDRSSNVWVGVVGGLIRGLAGRFELISETQDIRAIADDSKGRVYLGLNVGGIARLSGSELTRFGRREGLPSETIRSFFVESDDTLWIGTFDGGLVRFKNDRFFAFPSRRPGLPRDIGSILMDDDDCFWFGSSQGVFRIPRKELDDYAEGRRSTINPVQYTRTEGLRATSCAGGQQPAAWKSRDGRLWFATDDGVAVADPKTIPRNLLPPPVVIENFIVDDGAVSSGRNAGATGFRAPKAGDPEAGPIVPAGSRRVEIQYTALSFTAPDKVRFKYRLEGFDPQWTDAGARRAAYFHGLPPGSYRFRVAACNNDGVWNEAGASLAFVVLPHYWQTWWFQCVSLLVGGGFLMGLARYSALRKVRRRLEILERQQAVDRERMRIAKDMHDDLGASLTRISMLGEIAESQLGEKDDARQSIRKISDTSRDVVRAMDEILWALNPRNDTLENLAAFVSAFAQEHLALANIQCRLDFPMQLPDCPLDSEVRHNLLLAVKETLNNAIKHSGATEVDIKLRLRGPVLELSITDNGRGFDPSLATSGDGLMNLPKRLESIGGKWTVTSEKGRGTDARIELPLRNNGG